MIKNNKNFLIQVMLRFNKYYFYMLIEGEIAQLWLELTGGDSVLKWRDISSINNKKFLIFIFSFLHCEISRTWKLDVLCSLSKSWLVYNAEVIRPRQYLPIRPSLSSSRCNLSLF